MALTYGERQLQGLLNANADSFEDFFESDSVNRPMISRRGAGGIARKPHQGGTATQIKAVPGNPTFSAQFDMNTSLRFFSQDVATGLVWTAVTPAALLAAEPTMATRLAAFYFGFSDFTAGYANAVSQFPLAVWQYAGITVRGKDPNWENIYGSNWEAAVGALLAQGDVIQHFEAVSGGGVLVYHAYIIQRCTQVGYATLLNAMASDRFVINNIRYILTDVTAPGLLQYANNIVLLTLSLYGKANKDFISPNSFKQPKDFQNGIIDVPLKRGIDKQETLATYINYNIADYQWSVFVWSTSKI